MANLFISQYSADGERTEIYSNSRGQAMADKDKWDSDQHVDDFNKAAKGEQKQAKARDDNGSEQVKNTKLGLQDGPPPPQGPGMDKLHRNRHREAMAKDNQRALGKNNPAQDKKEPKKENPEKPNLKKEFNRSR
jgi:hypothetical protein